MITAHFLSWFLVTAPKHTSTQNARLAENVVPSQSLFAIQMVWCKALLVDFNPGYMRSCFLVNRYHHFCFSLFSQFNPKHFWTHWFSVYWTSEKSEDDVGEIYGLKTEQVENWQNNQEFVRNPGFSTVITVDIILYHPDHRVLLKPLSVHHLWSDRRLMNSLAVTYIHFCHQLSKALYTELEKEFHPSKFCELLYTLFLIACTSQRELRTSAY